MVAMSGRTSLVYKRSTFFVLLSLLPLLSFPAEANVNFHKFEVNYQTWAPDSVQVSFISVNGQYPGPSVRTREGDTVVVQLENFMPNESIVIHWQGIRQIGTHYGLQRSVGLYGSLIVDAACKEPFTYYCQLSIVLNDWWHKSSYEQTVALSSNQFSGEPQLQLDGIIPAHQNTASDKKINKWLQFAKLESFSVMGKGIINGVEEKLWTGQCKRVNRQRKLVKRGLLPKPPKPNRGHGSHHH